MSGEQRVTDEDLANWSKPATDLDIAAPLRTLALIAAVRDSRTAHRATEAKLTAALAEVERFRAFYSIMSRACGNWREWPKGAVSTDAPDYTHDDWLAASRAILERDELESALAATKAKLEAAAAQLVYNAMALEEAGSMLAAKGLPGVGTIMLHNVSKTREIVATLTTKEAPDATR